MYVWRRDQGRCVICGSHERVWFEYIVPVRKGGSNTERNIRLLCERCKSGNKRMSKQIWRRKQSA